MKREWPVLSVAALLLVGCSTHSRGTLPAQLAGPEAYVEMFGPIVVFGPGTYTFRLAVYGPLAVCLAAVEFAVVGHQSGHKFDVACHDRGPWSWTYRSQQIAGSFVIRGRLLDQYGDVLGEVSHRVQVGGTP